MKTTNRFALAAVAGLLMSGASSFAAQAADLGGNCCADLEERVAELEATTARKSNRLVSLTIGGQVNRGILWYDDGSMTGFRAADSIESTSRMRMIGSAKIASGWSAGYYLEIEYVSTGSFGTDQIDTRRALAPADALMITQGNAHGNSPFSMGIRQAHWYLKNDRLGTVSVGRLNTAVKDFPGVDLGGIAVIAENDLRINNGQFFLRRQGQTGREGLCANGLGCSTNLRWSDFSGGLVDQYRVDGVRYDSPTIMGFTLSASVSDDVKWDVALRYSGEWNGFKVASAVGYMSDMDEQQYNGEPFTVATGVIDTTFRLKTGRREANDFKYNWSVLHIGTGLFMNGAWWHREFNGSGNIDQTSAAFCQNNGINCQKPDVELWWLAGGIRRNFFGIGDTSIYGQYGKVTDGITGIAANYTTGAAGAAGGASGGNNFGAITDSSAKTIGAGVVQNIDAAAMTMYLGWQHRTADVTGCLTAVCAAANSANGAVTVKQSFEALDTVYGGAVIRF